MNVSLSILFLIFSAGLTKIFSLYALDTGLMDHPNERSMHIRPTVRGGGAVFMSLALISFPLLCYLRFVPFYEVAPLACAIFLLAFISFMDDLFQLTAKLRFIVQCLVALVIIAFFKPNSLDFIDFSIVNPYLIGPFLFFSLIWAINHFNFMDGLDGFCTCQALFLVAVYAFLLPSTPGLIYHDFCLVFVFILIGFLIFNAPPAALFMGDVGSSCLGLVTFAIAIIAQKNYNLPLVYWFLLNALFLFDATVTLLRRIWNKEAFFSPHKKHAYQRLKQSGWSSQLILIWQSILNLFFLSLVLLLIQQRISLLTELVLQIGLIAITYIFIERMQPMYNSSRARYVR